MELGTRNPLGRFVICKLDGVDITSDTTWASEEEGVASCIKRDKSGRPMIIDDRVRIEFRHGKIEFSLRDDAPVWIRDSYVAARQIERGARNGQGD